MEQNWVYKPNILDAAAADRWHKGLIQEAEWEQGSLRMYGKELLFPRLMAWYGDPGSSYRFSGKTYQPHSFTPLLLDIKSTVEQIIQSDSMLSPCMPASGFNSVLLNWYRQGQDSMSWHADDEPELGEKPFIASLSLGSARWFHFKPKTAKKSTNQPLKGLGSSAAQSSAEKMLTAEQNSPTQKILLEHASLFVMFNDFQSQYVHALPKTKREVGDRINLTFRSVKL